MTRLTAMLAVSAAATGCTTTPPAASTSVAPTSAAAPPLPPPAPAAQLTPSPALVRAVSEAQLGSSWRPGCPVPPGDLRRVELDFLGFDGLLQRGAMVVHRDLVEEVIAIFEELRAMNYPIERMRTVENYPESSDELSMRDNNTSAFNCRGLPGSGGWSWHAYGRAVDVNPLINPYVDGNGRLEPATAQAYLDRSRDIPGMLRADSPAVRAFTDRGWQWGGAWRDPVDYQHFERR